MTHPSWASIGFMIIAVFGSSSARSAEVRSDQLTEHAAMLQALERLRISQVEDLKTSPAFHDFQFVDAWTNSGIRFQHRVVDDAGKYYKPVHYDHGGGMAVADVDGDGWLDVFFTTQLGNNQLWRNLGGGRFEDITQKAGVGLTDPIAVGASFADVDNDGDPDLFVTTVRHGNHFYRNQGGGAFEEVTEQAGLKYSGHSSGAVFFDYDNDGKLDLFLCNVGVYTTNRVGRGGYFVGLRDGFSGHMFPERTEYSLLYQNQGDCRFKEVSTELGLRDGGWTGDATFADLDGDRFPELYVLNMQGDDRFYVNQGGKRFLDQTSRYFPKTPWGAMGIKFFDFDQDGRQDLFVTDMHSDMTEIATRTSKTNMAAAFESLKADPWCTTQYDERYLQGSTNNFFGNAFYLNRGNGHFEEVSGTMGAETFWPWGLSAGDLNADGYDDVFVTAGMGFGFRYAVNSVLLNERGARFRPAEFALGVEPRAGGRIQKVAFVLDCSGADRTHPLCSGRTGEVPFLEPLSSRSSAIFDLDNDGDLDIVTLEMNDRPQVLVSDLAARSKRRILAIRLVGASSNRDGLGARVKVTTKGRTLSLFSDGKSGYFGQSVLPLYFGLGESRGPVSIEVQWPSGKRQVVNQEVPSRGMLEIREVGP
jgi:hypothetical protein